MDVAERYAFDTYTLRRKVFKLFGGAFHVYGPNDQVVLYSEQKAFRLKEDFRLYSDENKSQELLRIRTQSVFDISGTYDVVDSTDEQTLGALRRKGFKSMFKDEWLILDAEGNEIGSIKEDSAWKATLRRLNDLAAMLMPQSYHVTLNGAPVATIKQNFMIFAQKVTLDLTPDTGNTFDPRLALAAAVLILAIEGRQQ